MVNSSRLRLGLFVAILLGSIVFSLAGRVTSDEKAPCEQTSIEHASEKPTADKPPSKRPAADEKPRVLFPLEGTVLMSGHFDVIAKGFKGPLEVDGRPVPWEPFKAPVRVGHVYLSPGYHQLNVGKRRMEFVVALNSEEHDGPEDWLFAERHEMSGGGDACADCHATKDDAGLTVVGDLLPHKACFHCHEKDEFEPIHSRALEPDEQCRKCHALHGSTREFLLKASVK